MKKAKKNILCTQNSQEYDIQWQKLDDFIKYNPGARHRRRIILSLLKKIKFETLIDIGCGSGELLMYLSKYFKTNNTFFYGADFAEQTIINNQKKFKNIEFFLLDIQKEYLQEKYDVVICSEVIEHLYGQRECLSNLVKMIKPDGWLILTSPTGKIFKTEINFGHVYHPSSNDIINFAEENGLKVISINNWGWPIYSLLKRIININSNWSLKNFGEGKYSTFKKLINNILYIINFLNCPNTALGCQMFVLLKKINN